MENNSYKLLISNEAYQDIDDAIAWYEEQAEGLGMNFIARFNDARAFLQSNPLIYQKVAKEFRKIRMKKFPYAIYFAVDEDKKELIVVAVWHQKKDIRKLTRRIRFD